MDRLADARPSPPTRTLRERFVVLDGLRGICALAVVVYHTSFLRGVAPDIMASGYLAVDCFFMMSGFVLCHAYGRLLDAGTVGAFLRKRWVRLAPIWWVGVALCLVDLVALHFDGGVPTALGELIVNLAMMPFPWSGSDRLFRLNDPGWSLFYELVINLIYAAILHRLGQRGLAAVMLLAAIALGVLSWGPQTTNGGPFWAGSPIALARVTFSFLAGALLYRARLARRGDRALVALGLCAAVVALFLVDVRGIERWAFDIAVTLVALPAIVVAGTIVGAPPRLARAFERLGILSYPLYAVHWPAFVLAKQIFGRIAGWGVEMPAAVVTGVVLVLIPIAYLLGITLDPIAARIGAALDGRLSPTGRQA